MRSKFFSFCAAVFLLVSASAAADPFRYREQPERGRAWVIDGQGLFLEQTGKPRRPVALPEWQWAGEPYACAPDVAIGPRGEAVVTSNVLPILWKIDPETLAVSRHGLQLDADSDKDVGFSNARSAPPASAASACTAMANPGRSTLRLTSVPRMSSRSPVLPPMS